MDVIDKIPLWHEEMISFGGKLLVLLLNRVLQVKELLEKTACLLTFTLLGDG